MNRTTIEINEAWHVAGREFGWGDEYGWEGIGISQSAINLPVEEFEIKLKSKNKVWIVPKKELAEFYKQWKSKKLIRQTILYVFPTSFLAKYEVVPTETK